MGRDENHTSSDEINHDNESSHEHHGKAAKVKTTGPLHNQRYKMKLCQHYEIEGHCPYNEKCQFAHGQTELEKWANRRKRQAERAVNAAVQAGGRRESISSMASSESNPSPAQSTSASQPVATQIPFISRSPGAIDSAKKSFGTNFSSILPSIAPQAVHPSGNNGHQIPPELPQLQVKSIPSPNFATRPLSSSPSSKSIGAPSSTNEPWEVESKEDCFSPLLSPSGIQNSPWYDEPDVMKSLSLQQQARETRSPSGNSVGWTMPELGTPIWNHAVTSILPSQDTVAAASQLFGMRTVFPASLNTNL